MIGCGTNPFPGVDFPDIGNDADPCCTAAGMFGHAACTCWTPVYNLPDQAPPDLSVKPERMPRACGDCAYRPDSPERNGHPDAVGTPQLLQDLVESGTPFWCHDGMRRLVGFVHPSGHRIEVDGPDLAYQPPMVGDVPYRADGRPGAHCAGWAVRRDVFAQEQRAEHDQARALNRCPDPVPHARHTGCLGRTSIWGAE